MYEGNVYECEVACANAWPLSDFFSLHASSLLPLFLPPSLLLLLILFILFTTSSVPCRRGRSALGILAIGIPANLLNFTKRGTLGTLPQYYHCYCYYLVDIVGGIIIIIFNHSSCYGFWVICGFTHSETVRRITHAFARLLTIHSLESEWNHSPSYAIINVDTTVCYAIYYVQQYDIRNHWNLVFLHFDCC